MQLKGEFGNGGKVEWAPSADISETEKEYVIRAELPAVKKEDVQVTFEDGMITIKGERKQQKEDKNEKYHRVESFHGSFVVVRVSPKACCTVHINALQGKLRIDAEAAAESLDTNHVGQLSFKPLSGW
jgi:HSP20 family molecular chaperone IbpA